MLIFANFIPFYNIFCCKYCFIQYLLLLEFVLLIIVPIFFVIIGLVDSFISLQSKIYNKSIAKKIKNILDRKTDIIYNLFCL